MSTVVITKNQVAFDNQVTENTQSYTATTPKVVMTDKAIWSGVGELAVINHIFREMSKPGAVFLDVVANIPKEHDWTTFCLSRRNFLEGIIWTASTESIWGLYINLPIATGTGSDFATGALGAGADAEGACKIACQHDIYSGKHVSVYDLSTAFSLMKNVKPNTLVDLAGKPLAGTR